MTNVMTLVHVDAHRIGPNERFCQTAERDGRLYIIALNVYVHFFSVVLDRKKKSYIFLTAFYVNLTACLHSVIRTDFKFRQRDVLTAGLWEDNEDQD